jgi:hypothetical protein
VGDAGGGAEFPLIREPSIEVALGPGGEVHQQLRKLKLLQMRWRGLNMDVYGFRPSRGLRIYSRVTAGGLPGLDETSICEQVAAGPCHYILRSAEEEAILRGLVRDGLARGVRAWGGPDRFKAEACQPSLLHGNMFKPIVYDELKKFCGRRN